MTSGIIRRIVVSYSVPISNHNVAALLNCWTGVVSYSVPISNHNVPLPVPPLDVLYLILFLYQTTTMMP